MTRPKLRFVDVGPRDGLQNEGTAVPLDVKIGYIEKAAETGVGEVEAGAFVSPKIIPQMADSDEVFSRIKRKAGIVYSALVPNEKGLQRALRAKADKVAVFTSPSETFNQKNIAGTLAESLERFRPVVTGALKEGVLTRGYISMAFHCPFEGKMPPEKIIRVVDSLRDLGIEEISIGDTIGKAAPEDVRELLGPLLDYVEADRVYLHFHNTYGMAVSNALTAWKEFGISGFDASSGGLGGCPYAPGASGNVALEDLVYAFEAEGGVTGVDIDTIRSAISWVEPVLGHLPDSKLSRLWGKNE